MTDTSNMTCVRFNRSESRTISQAILGLDSVAGFVLAKFDEVKDVLTAESATQNADTVQDPNTPIDGTISLNRGEMVAIMGALEAIQQIVAVSATRKALANAAIELDVPGS